MQRRDLLARHVAENLAISVATMPPTLRQRRFAIAVVMVLLAAFGVAAPFASVQLPRIDGPVAITIALTFVTNLVTAILIFSLCSIIYSRALLVLASGFLFSSLIMIPYALTFSGVLWPTALLGTGIQNSPWLFLLWRFGFLAAVICYALLKDESPSSGRSPIGWSVLLIAGLIFTLAWAVSIFANAAPHLLLEGGRLTPFAHYIAGLDFLISVLALLSLWFHRSSVLDQWLMVVIYTMMLELAMVTFFIAGRDTVGVYCVRAFLVVASTVVLAALLSEAGRLYAAVARANLLLQREQDNKLMNLEAMAASIAHEVRQPLTAISTNAIAARRFLRMTQPNHSEAEAALDRILNASHSTSEVFDGIRSLFQRVEQGLKPIDVNQIILEVLQSLRGELSNHDVIPRPELTSELPLVDGNRSQLQQVIINLFHNAIEAMDATTDRRRVLRVTTELHGRDAIAVGVEDSGPGIDPKQAESIFGAFVTTKSHGMGLGLAICRMIIERHGGQLTVLSDGKSGALFKCVLPIKFRDKGTAGGE